MRNTNQHTTAPPNIKAQRLNFKMNNRPKSMIRKPKNRELYQILINNPYISIKERDALIKKHCGVLMPRKIKF